MRGIHLPARLASQRTLLGWLGVGLLSLAIFMVRLPGTVEKIDSYQSCAQAGYPVAQTNPPICRGPKQSFTGPADAPEAVRPAAHSQEFTVLVDGDTGSGTYPKTTITISNQTNWERFWHEVHAGLSTQPPLISVDFTKQDVIVITTGPQATDGYTLKVTSVVAAGSSSAVTAIQGYPTTLCPVTAKTSNRYLILVTDKLPQPVSFHVSDEARVCN